jgi:2-polyprenyl-3-methyl-5-hydroxy-6-metoxy-1,4-benzoquinol methylase
VSFETIEHVDFDQQLIDIFFNVLKPGGKLICSTPNQDVMPFDKERFAFHIKHYTNIELVGLLTCAGFSDIELFAQHDPVAGEVIAGNDGCFTIAVASK